MAAARRLGRAVPLVAGLVLFGCDRAGRLAGELLDLRTPRERYVAGLEQAGLTETAVYEDWLTAGARALTEAPLVAAPHLEEVGLPAGEPAAIGLRVELRRGQRVRFEVTPVDSTVIIFLEAWRLSPTDSIVDRVDEADPGERHLDFEPDEDARYLFRAQPELLRGGRFSVAVRISPTLAFPVSGRAESDIRSRWGASRDGGRRSHQGVDIFAPHGTAVLAASAGRVVRVGENELGGNVVWLRDERGYTQYYAHLSAQLVADGDQLRAGDTVGLVGNTGNARTTPPHLHFGIYRRGLGPVDPFWFLHQPVGDAVRRPADLTLIGEHVRPGRGESIVRADPAPRAPPVGRLTRSEPARVLAVAGSWLRVRLVDGTTGFVAGRSAERTVVTVDPPVRGTGVVTARADES